MKISHYPLVFILIFLQSGCSTEVDQHTSQAAHYQLTTEKALEEVLDDTIFAITERNFRITGHLHIGKGIRDRKNPDFPDYEVIQYCNLVYAKKMLELDPDIINSCPGRITVRQDDEKVVIMAPLWPVDMNNEELKLHMQNMNALVHEIVDYAADDWLLVYDKKTAATE